MTYMIPFFTLFENIARTETRDVTFTGSALIPDDSYAFLEFFCADPDCDCQMVMLGVLSKKQPRQVARIVYTIERDEVALEYADPDLDRSGQIPFGNAMVEWLAGHLEQDAVYRERLRRHYSMVKAAAADSHHPAHSAYLAWKESMPDEDLEEEPVKKTKKTPSKASKKKPTEKSPSVPVSMRPRYQEIVEMTDRFCHEYLNEEYRDLCRTLAASLARKRPSPLNSGQVKIWAAGIVYALAQVNFAFDKTQTPHIHYDEIAQGLGVRKATASQKASTIRKLLRIHWMEPDWTLPSQIGKNPIAWQIMVDGFPMDARYAPREIQELAFLKGIIPYIPGEEE